MCPKCKRTNGWDIRQYDDHFPICVHCGYVDYSKPYVRPKYKSKGLMYSAPYSGKFDAFKYKEATIQVIEANAQNKKGGVDYLVTCPLCNESMKEKKAYYKYHCNNKHNITICSKGEELTWT